MTSVLDEKRRVVLPRDIAEELGLVEGSSVTFQRRDGTVIMKKVKSADQLRRMMSWNPKRRGKLLPVKESEIKNIWS